MELPTTFEEARHPSFPGRDATPAQWMEFLVDNSSSVLAAGIAAIPLLNERACETLANFVRENYDKHSAGAHVRGSMHKYGMDIVSRCPGLLRGIGAALEPIYELMYRSGHLTEETAKYGDEPRFLAFPHSAHCIAYGVSEAREQKLALHVDQSTYTATVCLAAVDLEGTDLVFEGTKPVAHPMLAKMQRKVAAGATHVQEVVCRPSLGMAFLHLGSHPHRTKPIEAGERVTTVLWFYEKSDSKAGGGAAAAPVPAAAEEDAGAAKGGAAERAATTPEAHAAPDSF